MEVNDRPNAGRQEGSMKRIAAFAIVLAATAGSVWGGAANYFEVTIDLTIRRALGSLYDARHSADTVQYIGCSISANVGEPATVRCEAKRSETVRLTCSSQDAEMVKAAQKLTDHGYLLFQCDEDYALTRVYASTSSIWLP
jgi:hypothetical protein